MPASNGLDKARSWNSRAQRFALVLLMAVGVTIATLVGPAGTVHAQTPPTSPGNFARPTTKNDSESNAKPFDLSYMPVEVKRIVAIRPGMILRSPGMKDHRFAVMSLLVNRILLLVQKLESIDQVVLGYGMTSEQVKAKLRVLEEPVCMMVRSADEFDWKRYITRYSRLVSQSDAPFMELKFNGKTYYKSTLKDKAILHPGECFLFPDAHTIVIGREEAVLRVIGKGRESRPNLARGDDWSAVERCPIAASVDEPEGLDDLSDQGLVVMSLLDDVIGIEGAQRLTCGIENLDPLKLHAIVTLPTAKKAREDALFVLVDQVMKAVEMTMIPMDEEDNPQDADSHDDHQVKLEKRLASEMMRMCQVRLEGRTIHLTKQTRLSLKDLRLQGF